MRTKSLLALTIIFIFSLFFYVEVNGQKTKPRAPQKGALSLEAGLVFKNGDVKPVARTDFYLIDVELGTLLNASGIEREKSVQPGKSDLLSYEISLAVWKRYPTLYEGKYEKVVDVLKLKAIGMTTTDFGGKGVFPSVKVGSYFLIGVGGIERQAIVWNMSLEIKAGNQSVVLDNKNSAAIF